MKRESLLQQRIKITPKLPSEFETKLTEFRCFLLDSVELSKVEQAGWCELQDYRRMAISSFLRSVLVTSVIGFAFLPRGSVPMVITPQLPPP
jgi:hypothetical protein